MKLSEALVEMKSEKKVRRSSWRNPYYYLMNSPCDECENELSIEDAIADDWEVMREQVNCEVCHVFISVPGEKICLSCSQVNDPRN